MLRAVTLERRKLFELVAEHLEGLILSGELEPGDQLPPERELQAAFGVGRPAVREALISLERAGLIAIGNGAPARVTVPSAAGLLTSLVPTVKHLLSTPEGNRQFQAVRLLVEVGLVRKAAKNATREFLDELSSILEQNRSAIADRNEFIQSDVAFHYAIARFAGDSAILWIHEAMSNWLSEQRVVSLRAEGASERALRHHGHIFASIESRNPDAAESAMEEHLKDVHSFYWSQPKD